MKQSIVLFYMLLLTTMFTHAMEEQQPRHRKPDAVTMEITHIDDKEPVYIHEGIATPTDRAIGCCIVMSIPCLMLSLCAYDKLKTIMNW